MSLKNIKTSRKCLENLLPEMTGLQVLKTLIFPRALLKLKNRVNFRIFSCLKLFSVSIIKKMTFIVSVKPN